jgi:uncharacterized protein YcnI
MSSSTRRAGGFALGVGTGLGALVLGAGPAAAHVSPDKSEVPAGGFTAVTLTVGHGCEESPTTQVVVQVPEGINDVTPGILPGWTIEVATEALPEPIEGPHGEQITERESTVTFTAGAGNELPDGFRQGYTLGFQAPDTPGEYLFFKTIQICAEGQTEWIEEYTGDGEEPEHPSPVVQVVASEGGHGGEEETETTDTTAATDTTATTEGTGTTAASPDDVDDEADDDGDDGGSDGLAIGGLVAGLLGLATGGAALAKAGKASRP